MTLMTQAEREANQPVKAESSDDDIRDRARELFSRDGEVEIDDDAVISRGSDAGAYVQAWVWVDDVCLPPRCPVHGDHKALTDAIEGVRAVRWMDMELTEKGRLAVAA